MYIIQYSMSAFIFLNIKSFPLMWTITSVRTHLNLFLVLLTFSKCACIMSSAQSSIFPPSSSSSSSSSDRLIRSLSGSFEPSPAPKAPPDVPFEPSFLPAEASSSSFSSSSSYQLSELSCLAACTGPAFTSSSTFTGFAFYEFRCRLSYGYSGAFCCQALPQGKRAASSSSSSSSLYSSSSSPELKPSLLFPLLRLTRLLG